MHQSCLTDHVERLFCQMNVPEEGRAYVRHVVANGPSRTVKNHYGNVMSRYPSKKMGHHILVESMAGELAKAMEYENDENVIAYFPQPKEIQINCLDRNGKRRGTFPYHPDFLVITKIDISIHEVRDDGRLYSQTLKHPNSYYRDEFGTYHFRPAEIVYQGLGLSYRIIHNSSMNAQLLNNARFLKDYLREDAPPVPPETLQKLVALLRERKYIAYIELVDEHDFSADHVISAVAGGYVDVNLKVERLDVPSDLIICIDTATSTAVRAARQKELQPVLPLPGVMRLRSGTVIHYDNVEYTVLICGERELYVRDKDGYITRLSLESVIALNNLNNITSDVHGLPPDAKKMLHDFDSAQWARAEIRLKALEEWNLKKFSKSSLNSFAYKTRGMTNELDRLIALTDHIPNRGNRRAHFVNEKENEYFIKALKCYNAPERMTKRGAYSIYRTLIEKHIRSTGETLDFRSYPTFNKACNDAESVLWREGEKAAYQKNPLDLFFSQPFPVHGTRPHEVCYIDHTTIPLATTDLDGVDLGKVNITLAVDGATRKRSAFWLSYDPPSAASVLMVLRDYVRCHGRVPTVLVLDNAKEFHSKELIFFCYLYGIELRYRPPSQPRGGALVEWALGANEEEVIQQLQGNTTNMKDPRMVSRSVYPFDRRVWTLVALHGSLNEYFRQYATRSHPALGMSPEEKEEGLYKLSGRREHTIVRFDENLMLLTCPHTKKWFHKIDNRRGIQTYGQFCWHPDFKHIEKNTRVEVRVEPWDANVLYVCLKGHWVTAIVRNLEPYRGRTSYQVQHACRAGARARNQIAKKAIISTEVLVQKSELFIPSHFDKRMSIQQSEMCYLAKALGMGIANSQAKEFIERTTADKINSPFEQMQWDLVAEQAVDKETAGPPGPDGEAPKIENDERDLPASLFDESTLRALRNYL